MARLRKAARLWRDPEKRAMGLRVLVEEAGPLFAIDLGRLFARRAPLEVELGAGRGDFIIGYAAAHPERNFLAVEWAASVARVLAIRAARAGLSNVRVARMDARTLINLMLPEGSVSACHIYFPDPWPALSQHKHRLFSPGFVRRLARVLRPKAMLCIATDFEPYAREIFAMLESAGFCRSSMAVPGATASGFARKYLAEGRTVFSAAFLPPVQAPYKDPIL
jgi:tRNA (guanine-N7-)-methyltransferase